MDLESSIRSLAARAGIQAVGIAPVTESVAHLYPWAKSVICAAVSYLPPESCCPKDVPRGLVARFARSADYHEVVRSKLHVLANGLNLTRFEVCVDTSPLPERELAALAGIGWIGNNCCVFVEGCGSYVALGEIVTQSELPLSSAVVESRCGACRRCLESCPTGALIAPGTLDTSRCLSHLTQSRTAIPSELQPLLGHRIYGCDVCQEVCPHNSGLVPQNPEFAISRFPGAYPELLPLVDITKADFDLLVRTSPIGWVGRSRIRRNAEIAYANIARGNPPGAR